MASSKFFSLNGFGYLENISYHESKCIATIKAINLSSEDDIYLDCEIQGALEEYLFAFLSEVKKGNTVLISFSAVYRKFRVAFSVQDSEAEKHDDHIIRLECKLLSIGNCYINGCPVNKGKFRFLKAA